MRGKQYSMSAIMLAHTMSGSTSHATLGVATTGCQLHVLLNVVPNVHLDVSADDGHYCTCWKLACRMS